MFRATLLLAAAAVGASAFAAPALAQNEQYMPALVYRTGPYAPNGIPFANGVIDYWNMINERDGGINGVKIISEECETGYATDKGVECYERLKGKLGVKSTEEAEAEAKKHEEKASKVFKPTEKGWTEDPWEKLMVNDVNKQMVQFQL